MDALIISFLITGNLVALWAHIDAMGIRYYTPDRVFLLSVGGLFWGIGSMLALFFFGAPSVLGLILGLLITLNVILFLLEMTGAGSEA